MVTIGTGVLQVAFDPKQVEQAGRDQLVPSAKRIAGDLAGVFAAAKIGGGILTGGVDELKEAQAANAQVEAAILSTGGAAGVSAAHIDDMAQSLLKLSGTDDEAVKGAEAILLGFTNIKNSDVDKTFDRTTLAALNLATRMGGDVTGAAQTLGRALQDPEKGMGRLQRVIGPLTQAQQDQVKAFTDQNDIIGAQNVLLDVLETRVGGAAAAFGNTLPGQLSVAQESVKNMKAELVGALAPALEVGARGVTFLTEEFDKLPEGVQQAVGAIALVGGSVTASARLVNDVILLTRNLRPARDAAAAGATVQAGAEVELAAAQTASNVATGEAALLATGLIGTEAEITAATAARTAATIAAATAEGEWAAASAGLVASESGLAASSLAATGAAEAQAAAVTALAAAEGEAAVAGSAMALAIPGVALVAATAGLYLYGRSLNKTTLDSQELDRVTKLTGDDLATGFAKLDKLAQGGGAFGGMLDSTIQGLIDKGPAGVGVLQEYRDHLASTGQDTSKFDAALTAARVAQDNLNAATAAGNSVLGESTQAMDLAATAANRLTTARAADEEGLKSGAAAARGVFDAEQAYAQAQRGVADASRGVVTAQRAVADASRGVVTAQKAVADAYRGVEDSERRLIDAQAALDRAMQPASQESLGKAQLGVSDANLRVADAANAIVTAQYELDKANAEGGHTAADLAEKQRKVAEANNAYQSALFAVTDAESSLQDVQAKGTAADQAVIDARRAVDDATRAVADANERVSESAQGVIDAQARVATSAQGVIDAQARVNEAYATEATSAGQLSDAQYLLANGAESAATSTSNQIAALQGVEDKLAPGSPLRQRIDDYIAQLYTLKAVFAPHEPTAADIAASLSQNPGQFSPTGRAAGGRVGPNELFRGAERGPELMFGDGIYQAPPQGAYVMPAGDTQRWLEDAMAGASRSSGRGGVHIGQVLVSGQNAPDALHELPAVMRQIDTRLARRG